MAATARSSTLTALVCALVVPVGVWVSSAPSVAAKPTVTSQLQVSGQVSDQVLVGGLKATPPRKSLQSQKAAKAHKSQNGKPKNGKPNNGKKAKKKGPKKSGIPKTPWWPTSPTTVPSAASTSAPSPISVTATSAPTPRSTPTTQPTVVRSATPAPTPTVPAVATPTPTPKPTAAPTYALMTDRSGNVPRWNPCAGEITVKLSTPGLAAADESAAEAELIWALGQLNDTTGLAFTYAGRTTELAAMTSRMTTAQIVVSYASTAQSSLLAGDSEAAGFGGSWIAGSTRMSGFVVVNTDTTNALSRSFDGGVSRPAVLLHELGHVVGLDHVDSEVELMGEWLSETSPGTFAEGDRQGLQLLGAAQGCTP